MTKRPKPLSLTLQFGIACFLIIGIFFGSTAMIQTRPTAILLDNNTILQDIEVVSIKADGTVAFSHAGKVFMSAAGDTIAVDENFNTIRLLSGVPTYVGGEPTIPASFTLNTRIEHIVWVRHFSVEVLRDGLNMSVDVGEESIHIEHVGGNIYLYNSTNINYMFILESGDVAYKTDFPNQLTLFQLVGTDEGMIVRMVGLYPEGLAVAVKVPEENVVGWEEELG